MLATYLVYSAISATWMLIITMNIQPTGIYAIDIILPPKAFLTVFILTFIFYVVVVWLISKENVRSVFAISKKVMIYTISITALIMVLVIYLTIIR